MDNLIVQTSCGTVEGTGSADGKCRIFRGVPYAEPPVGPLRFCRPQPKKPWQGTRPCMAFPPKAYQGDLSKDGFYSKEFYFGMDASMSEDCLYLNIWAPPAKQENPYPVLLWIHGGAFMHGCGSEAEFDGEGFAEKEVILVTINYRVGALGFFAHSRLEEETAEGVSGNYGLWDQAAALKWVYDNIEAFGGDPSRISIAGQSAGCMSAQCLISSPVTKGQIAGAILQSGGGLPGLHNQYSTESIKAVSLRLMEKLNVSTVQQLREVPPESIVSVQYELMAEAKGLCWAPNVDGCLLPAGLDELAKSGQIHNIPYIIGSTKNDMGTEAAGLLQESAVNWSKNLEQLGRKPAYVYYFTRDLPGDLSGAFHSCELWYEFGTMDRCWRPFTAEDYSLSRILSGQFAAFVKNGAPNVPGLPLWKPCSAEQPYRMVYDTEPACVL